MVPAEPQLSRGSLLRHNFKVEKCTVLEGSAVVRFRHMSTNEATQREKSADKFIIVDIPLGWTDSIGNKGPDELIVLLWISEVIGSSRLDAHSAEVLP